MRPCPVCEYSKRTKIFSMTYQIPDGWTLPAEIVWHTCDACGMIYGDGEFDQAMLNKYYRTRYGYGVNNPVNIERLKQDAERIAQGAELQDVIIDFGGEGDDGKSVLTDRLKQLGHNALSISPGETIPSAGTIYASHVIEHVYDLPATMRRLVDALAWNGTLIIDVPDATGLLNRWKMPILDYNTKHVNHFKLRNLLDLGHYHGLEMVELRQYEMEFAPCFQVHFKRLDVAKASDVHIGVNAVRMMRKLLDLEQPVNVWGMSDIVWYLLSQVELNILNYIDNDPAYRGQTFKGKPVLERPDNDAPIVIMAQGQRGRLIENIRKAGIKNQIIPI